MGARPGLARRRASVEAGRVAEARLSRTTRPDRMLYILGTLAASTRTRSEVLRVKLPPDPHASDERVLYVACLLVFFVFLQAAAFAGHSRVAVFVSSGGYFAGAVVAQGGPAHARLVNAAALSAMLTLLGYGLGLAG